MEEGRWRGWDNAEIYDRFVRERKIYRWLNEELVARADLRTAHRVLDLGCGTGATTEACLRLLPADGEIVGLDASAEMVEVARAQTLDPRASFVVGDAAAVAGLVEGSFDRVLSNAAFWQFGDRRAVFAALAELLEPGAIFAFNVPAERSPDEETPIHPFQVALARAIESQAGAPFRVTATPFDPARLPAEVEPLGFSVERCDRLEWVGPQGELMDLMHIPAMIAPVARGLGEEEKRQALAQARSAADPSERVRVPWFFLVLRRDGSA